MTLELYLLYSMLCTIKGLERIVGNGKKVLFALFICFFQIFPHDLLNETIHKGPKERLLKIYKACTYTLPLGKPLVERNIYHHASLGYFRRLSWPYESLCFFTSCSLMLQQSFIISKPANGIHTLFSYEITLLYDA